MDANGNMMKLVMDLGNYSDFLFTGLLVGAILGLLVTYFLWRRHDDHTVCS